MARKSFKVFISFRGPDTRYGFLKHLCAELETRDCRIVVVTDENFKRGNYILSEIEKAINESAMSIAIISDDYAGSDATLDELVMMLKRQENEGKAYMVLPIYYHTKKEEVKKQTGSFATALADMEEEFDEFRRKEWRQALAKVTELSGRDVLAETNENTLCRLIVDDVLKQVAWLENEGIVSETLSEKSHGIEASAGYSKKAKNHSLPSNVGENTLSLDGDPANCKSGITKASSSKHRPSETSIINALEKARDDLANEDIRLETKNLEALLDCVKTWSLTDVDGINEMDMMLLLPTREEIKLVIDQSYGIAPNVLEVNLGAERFVRSSENFRNSLEELQAREGKLKKKEAKMEKRKAELADVEKRIEEGRKQFSSLADSIHSYNATDFKLDDLEKQKEMLRKSERDTCQSLEDIEKFIDRLISKVMGNNNSRK